MGKQMYDYLMDLATNGNVDLYTLRDRSIENIVDEMCEMDRGSTLQNVIDKLELDEYDQMRIQLVNYLYQHWMDKDKIMKIKDSKENLLNEPDLSDWRNGYHHALAKVIAKHGIAISPQQSHYGWCDYQMKERHGDIVSVSNIKEDEWTEFAGTFDGDRHESGMVADVIYADGYNCRVRLVRSIHDIMQLVLNA